jgi:HEAT repeat protein
LPYESPARTVVYRPEFLGDPQPAVRLAAAEKLGDAAPEGRLEAMGDLERALALEPEAGVRHLLLWSLVKAGRTEATEPLRRLADRDPSLKP